MINTDLVKPYSEFKEYITTTDLDEFDTKWLHEWDQIDMALSPMNDDFRRILRYGHYLGYIANMRDD